MRKYGMIELSSKRYNLLAFNCTLLLQRYIAWTTGFENRNYFASKLIEIGNRYFFRKLLNALIKRMQYCYLHFHDTYGSTFKLIPYCRCTLLVCKKLFHLNFLSIQFIILKIPTYYFLYTITLIFLFN